MFKLRCFGDLRMILMLIGMIDVDNLSLMIYGIGYYGLWKIMGVKYFVYYDGVWWCCWWNENCNSFF